MFETRIVGIIGVGFVGDALLNSFQQFPINVKAFDKFKNIGNFKSTLESNIIFLCLPTLFNPDTGEYDKSALHEVCKNLQKSNYKGIIVIKSTVEPGTSETLAQKYGLAIIHNPEFLTARTAREDFHNQNHIVLGETSISALDNTHLKYLKEFYSQLYPKARISECKSWESESMKIFVNSFYAMKVQIFNEFYLLCKKQNMDYNRVVQLMLQNGWINPMHTNVPGPDGKLSYGGACFPKDTQALLNYMKQHDTEHAVLEACIKERNQLRND